MKKPILWLLGSAIVAALIGGAAWLLFTSSGARFLLAAVSRFSAVEVDARRIQGRLMGDLQLHEVEVRWPQGEARAAAFHLSWRPWSLLWQRTLALDRLEIHELLIQDRRPEIPAPLNLNWPSLPPWLTLLNGEMDQLAVNGLVYRRSDGEPLVLEKLSARLSWRRGTAVLGDILLHHPRLRLEGTMEAGFLRPHLRADLRLRPTPPVQGVDFLTLRADLSSARPPEQVAGGLQVTAASGGKALARIEGTIGLTPEELRIHHLFFTRPGRQGKIEIAGAVAFPAAGPRADLALKLTGLDLSPEVGVKTLISGVLELSGGPQDYRGRFDLRHSGRTWQAVRASGIFRGNKKGLTLSEAKALVLGGSVRGQAEVGWTDGLRANGIFQGQALNPALISPDWPGVVNFSLQGAFRRLAPGREEGWLKASLQQSALRGRALTGEVDARLRPGSFHLARLELHGRGFDLQASGVLQDRLAFAADIRDLSGLVPQAKGTLRAAGWVRWRERRLAGSFSGSGRQLLFEKWRAAAVEFSGHLADSPLGAEPPPIGIRARLEGVSRENLRIQGATLEVAGTLDRHSGEAGLRWPEGRAGLSFTGTYGKGVWQGKILSLSGRDEFSSWAMAHPVELRLSGESLQSGPLRITSSRGEDLQCKLDLSFRPWRGVFQAKWEGIDLSRANPWIGDRRLDGRGSGLLQARWPEQGPPSLTGSTDLSGTFRDPRLTLTLSQSQIRFNWDDRGLKASLELVSPESGSLQASASSPQPPRWGLPEQGSAEIRFEAVDAGLLNPWVPSGISLATRLSGKLGGSWAPGARFEVAGEGRASPGALSWPYEGRKVLTNLREAQWEWIWREETLQGRFSCSFTDYGSLEARFRLPLLARFPPAVHPSGALGLAVSGNLREKGLLSTLFPKWIRDSAGEVDLLLRAEGTLEKPEVEARLGLQRVRAVLLWPETEGGPPREPLPLDLPRGKIEAAWKRQGLSGAWNLSLGPRGRLEGKISSPEPARPAFPERGDIQASFQGIRLDLFRAWLSPVLRLDGELSGSLTGKWFSGDRLDLTGGARITQGSLSWLRDGGRIEAPLRRAELGFSWRREELAGEISLALGEFGRGQGAFRLPLPARLPPAFLGNGPLQVTFTGQLQEKGLLPAVFPGLLQESQGRLNLNLSAGGTWGQPRFSGEVGLAGAGAYFPAAGIHLRKLSARAIFSGDRIQIENLQARAGPGRIEGRATIWLENWQIRRYEGKLSGERFQTFYLPELQVLSNPRLEFSGTPRRLSVRGEIRLPQVQVYGWRTEGVIQPSPDIVLLDEPPPSRKELPLELDVRVRVILGDRVLVQAQGLDARLTGGIEVQASGPGKVTARGEIRIVQGHYGYYGIKLEITRGHFHFAGPVDRPTLDILALRKVDEVQAGVLISGTPQVPVVRLYSQPAMPDVDTLSFIVLGRPLGGASADYALLARVAGALLSRGESATLQDKLKSRLGVDVLDIQAGGGDVSRSMLTIGKYLSPQLFISYGRSLFTNAQLITLRYSLSRHWEIETKRGAETGVDLYYRIEFK